MKLKYPCLVLDHDDTTVNSTATVHYPCFVEYMGKYFPDVHMTLEEYFLYNFDPGVVELFTKICGMTWDQMLDEERYWKEYVKHHVPKAYPGIREILLEQKKRGGKICVVSHSFSENIRRDYRTGSDFYKNYTREEEIITRSASGADRELKRVGATKNPYLMCRNIYNQIIGSYSA